MDAHPAVIASVLDKGAGRVTGINSTTRDGLQHVIAQGIENGLSPRDLGDVIQAWSGWDEYRAERIATTELQFAYNSAAIATYGDMGVTQVQAIDGDDDPECAERNGQIFSVEEADSIEDHPNGTLDWVPVVGTMADVPEQYANYDTGAPGDQNAADFSNVTPPELPVMPEATPPAVDAYVPALQTADQIDLQQVFDRSRVLQRESSVAHADYGLRALWEKQGYDGLPEVIDHAALERHIADGEVQVYRGMRRVTGLSGPLDDLGVQFRTGDYFAGEGIFGNGTYTAGQISQENLAFELQNARGLAAADRAALQNQLEQQAYELAKAYSGGTDGDVITMTIRSDAKVIDYDVAMARASDASHEIELKLDNLATSGKSYEEYTKERDALRAEKWFLDDPGHWASLHGYDAIRKGGVNGLNGTMDYYVILNRTAVRVYERNLQHGAVP